MFRIFNNLSVFLLLFFLISLPVVTAIGQVFTPIHPDSAKPLDPTWEVRYRNRVDEMVNAFTYTTCPPGSAGVDNGKGSWPILLSQMYKNMANPSALNGWINGCGNNLVNSQWAGTMCGPFSGPGLSMYYFQFKDVLPALQKDRVRNYLYNPGNYPYRCPNGKPGWHFFMRPDQQMDPVYNLENPTTDPNAKFIGSEKNSENYHWMQRMPGYLFAEEFCDSNQTEDAQRLTFFRTWAKNWIRALYNVGRIEWNSVSYWGHTIQPLMALHQHVKNPEVKKMAKAALDWMVLELALHHIDGFQAGADVRAKEGAYRPFTGSSWGYLYYYFADQGKLPSYYTPGIFANKAKVDFIGYAPFSSYRPAQVLIDIAQRKIELPVEVQSAKPFYAFDHESYKDWKGNTFKSRRFEFETLWIEKDYLLSSLASNIPDGWTQCDRQWPFTEESLWRLAVGGTNSTGSVQIYGNSGSLLQEKKRHVGREPREQIGQFRNAMLRILHHPDSMWVEVPRTLAASKENQKLFLDFGNGVYAALQPFGALSLDTMKVPSDLSRLRYLWTFTPSSSLGALALEVGKVADFTSFQNFRNQISSLSSFVHPDTNTVVYTGANGHQLKMEFQFATQAYTMITPVIPACTVPNPGTLPKVWGNNQYIDFETWDSYRVSFGKEIVYQPWGGGFLDLRSADQGLQIRVDSTNGKVSYFTFDPSVYITGTGSEQVKGKGLSLVRVFPNPSKGSPYADIEIQSGSIEQVQLQDLEGKTIRTILAKPLEEGNQNRVRLNFNGLAKGIYLIRVQAKSGVQFGKMMVE